MIRLIDPYAKNISPGKEMEYISVGGKIKGFSEPTPIDVDFGDKVALVSSPIILAHGASQEVNDTTMDKVLSIGNVPVFVAANTP